MSTYFSLIDVVTDTPVVPNYDTWIQSGRIGPVVGLGQTTGSAIVTRDPSSDD